MTYSYILMVFLERVGFGWYLSPVSTGRVWHLQGKGFGVDSCHSTRHAPLNSMPARQTKTTHFLKEPRVSARAYCAALHGWSFKVFHVFRAGD